MGWETPRGEGPASRPCSVLFTASLGGVLGTSWRVPGLPPSQPVSSTMNKQVENGK